MKWMILVLAAVLSGCATTRTGKMDVVLTVDGQTYDVAATCVQEGRRAPECTVGPVNLPDDLSLSVTMTASAPPASGSAFLVADPDGARVGGCVDILVYRKCATN